MEFKIGEERSNKTKKQKLIIMFAGTLVGFFLFFEYIFPLIWPIILSVGLALLFYPVVRFCHERLKWNVLVSAILLFVIIFIITGFVVSVIMEKLLEQLELFVDNFSYYQAYVNNLVNHVCAKTENYFGIKTGLIRTTVNEQINGMINGMQPKVMNFLVGTSLPAVKTMVDIIVSGAVMLVLFFLLVKDMGKIQQSAKNSIFGKELGFFYHRGKVVFQAYIKAQVIIMIAVAACSIFGFTFAGNRYAWILGIAVGILDALPLFGSGIILIPATILYMIDGNFLKTAIIFTTFIICYFVREILEPKLIGEKMGVGPVATLIGIYVGYRIFGFMGMFAGALVVVVLSDIVKWCER